MSVEGLPFAPTKNIDFSRSDTAARPDSRGIFAEEIGFIYY